MECNYCARFECKQGIAVTGRTIYTYSSLISTTFYVWELIYCDKQSLRFIVLYALAADLCAGIG